MDARRPTALTKAAKTAIALPSRRGSLDRERPLEGGGRVCENTLGPGPHQAFGLGGRSHIRLIGPSGHVRPGR